MPKRYLSLVLDTAQDRLRTDRLGTLVSGNDWGTRFRQNAYVDPVTRTAMLMPAPRSESWNSSGSGDNARYQVSDYVLTSSKWVNDPILFASDYWIKGKDASGNPGEAVKTVATQPRNGGMYLAWYAANASQQDWVQMECGWGADPSNSASHPVSLRVYASGKAEVWRYGVYQGDINISGNATPQQTANTFTDLIITPYRRREVLLLSNRGGGGSILFEDIEDGEDPEVIPALPFWWYVPTGLAKVQCAPLRFATSGYVTGIKSYFREAPQSGAVETSLVSYDANGGTVEAYLVEPESPGSAFVPDGSVTVARARLDLAGDGTHTPNVYGCHLAYEGEVVSTPDAATVMDDWAVRLTLDVSDSPSDNRLTAELKNPQEIIDAGVANFLTTSNRPFELRMVPTPEEAEEGEEPKLFFTGRTEPIRYREASDDTGRRVVLEARDHWKAFEHYVFSDSVPLDGMNIIDAFRFLLGAAGFSEEHLDLEDVDFDLPSTGNPSRGDWNVLVQVGDSLADWLTRLHEDYMGTWFMGWVPKAEGFRFVLKSPEGLSSEPVYTLYCSYEEALLALGGGGSEGEEEGPTPEEDLRSRLPQLIYREYSDEVLEPEANDVWVTGFDPHTKRPIQAHKADYESQDPTTPVHLRPENWLGEVRKYGLFDSTITSQEALERAASILYDRLTTYRIVAEFTSEFLVKEDGMPVWRGDVVRLDGLGDYRIKSFSAQFVREPKTGDMVWRPTRYVAEQLLTPNQSLSQLAGDSLQAVIDSHKLKAITKSLFMPRSEDLVKMLPRTIVRL